MLVCCTPALACSTTLAAGLRVAALFMVVWRGAAMLILPRMHSVTTCRIPLVVLPPF